MKPWHEDDKLTLWCGDCLAIMQEMPTASVDLVICSPPYEDCRTYGIAFDLEGQAWVDWCKVRFMECCRISRGPVVWMVEGKTRKFRWSATPALLLADLHRAGVNLRKPPIYHRIGIPGSGGPDWWRNDYEFCIVATPPGKLAWSDNVATGHPPKYAPGGEMSYRLADGSRRNQWGGTAHTTARRLDGSREPNKPSPSHIVTKVQTRRKANGERARDGEYAQPVKANAGNVIKVKVGGGLMGSDMAHDNEAPFPESLIEPFVKCFCPPGGTTLDCFCGSGTSLAVSIKLGRKAIGIDVRESQCELSKKRVALETAQGTLTPDPTP